MSVRPQYQLKSDDGQLFLVERKFLEVSKFILQKLIDEGYNNQNCFHMKPIDVPCHSNTLRQVIKWIKRHYESLPKQGKITYSDFTNWDKDFFRMESDDIFALLNASNALGLPDLMKMGCAAAAEMVRGKNIDEIRTIYGIKPDRD